MLRFATDEDFNRDIVEGLRQRNPSIDIVTLQERGLRGLKDPDVLEWAASEGRLLLSHDLNTMRGLASLRIESGKPTPGVILVRQGSSPGSVIDALELLFGASLEDEWNNRVEYLESPRRR